MTAGEGLLPKTWPFFWYSMISLSRTTRTLSSLCGPLSLRNSGTFAVYPQLILKRINTCSRLWFKSGPVKRTLWRERPWCCALELKTTLIWSGFLGDRLQRMANTSIHLHFLAHMSCTFAHWVYVNSPNTHCPSGPILGPA